jgi:hypothetical protein
LFSNAIVGFSGCPDAYPGSLSKTFCLQNLIHSMYKVLFPAFLFLFVLSCQKNNQLGNDPGAESFNYYSLTVNGISTGFEYKGINDLPDIKVSFTSSLDPLSAAAYISMADQSGNGVPVILAFERDDSVVSVKPVSHLRHLSRYKLTFSNSLKCKAGGNLQNPISIDLITGIDTTNKFKVISGDSLLTLVQKRTFKYFWDYGHSISGLARERNSSGDIVTSGGSGFGMMAIPVAVYRNFITRNEGLVRAQKIVDFLKNKAQKFHGAYPHWLSGTTGVVIPFSPNDDGADLVETSYLVMGLLTLRQYFNGSGQDESALRNDINVLWNAVDWDFFTRDGSNKLYWHWSPAKNWVMNMPIQGWNECLITYVLAASSNTHSISKTVYDNGFARNGAIKNNNSYYGYQLPLGEALGGPLFYEQYSFLGINPNGLSDAYADYWTQAVNHTKINFEYCVANPRKYYGYSNVCWGLTASDIQGGYTASSPTNDVGVIAPTAAISSLPFTPEESVRALNFFYYKLGDKIWGNYGFTDAFNLDNLWFADSFLAIDQGPQIGMIENYRSGLLWNLFMSCPEIKTGMKKLGFQSPDL